tara:strand:+ start:224 stop:463 length:240 start_codon:yes stop_codon:yes gene_type:complete
MTVMPNTLSPLVDWLKGKAGRQKFTGFLLMIATRTILYPRWTLLADFPACVRQSVIGVYGMRSCRVFHCSAAFLQSGFS